MWNFITLSHMPFPPVLGAYDSPRTGKQSWSYGCEVLHARYQDIYSDDLCYLVVACMKPDGDRRPSLMYLETQIARHINQDWDQPDDDTEAEWRQFFGNP